MFVVSKMSFRMVEQRSQWFHHLLNLPAELTITIFPVLSIINNEAGILELLAKKTVSFQLYYLTFLFKNVQSPVTGQKCELL